jgi:hypothetical protein
MINVKRCYLVSPNHILFLNLMITFLQENTGVEHYSRGRTGDQVLPIVSYWFGFLSVVFSSRWFVSTKGIQIDNSGLSNRLKKPFQRTVQHPSLRLRAILKCRSASSKQHDAMSQTAVNFIFAAVRTRNFKHFNLI